MYVRNVHIVFVNTSDKSSILRGSRFQVMHRTSNELRAYTPASSTTTVYHKIRRQENVHSIHQSFSSVYLVIKLIGVLVEELYNFIASAVGH